MTDVLSPADRSALAAEQGSVNMSVGGVLVFDADPRLSRDAIAARIESRLHLVPRFRQRLRFAARGVTNPVWTDDDHFDLEWHLRSLHLDPPGTRERLGALIGAEFSRRLDRERPLWEIARIEGLQDDQVALVAKMHHSLVDGIAAVAIGMVLLDPTPEPLQVPPPERPWTPRGYDRSRHLARIAAEPTQVAQRFLGDTMGRAIAATDPRRAVGELRRTTGLVTELTRSRPAAPMTPLNNPLSPGRRYATVRGELATLREAGHAAGGTINDTILAVVTGMLRRWLARCDVHPDDPPVALVPVSVREEGEQGGNHLSTVLVELPIHLRRPAERIAAVHAAMDRVKESAAVRVGELFVGASGLAPPIISSTLARAMGGVRAFNLVVSNVPGPQQPFYFNGCRLREVYPVVPLNPGNQQLNVGVLSYDGGVFFGLMADRALEPGVEAAAEGLREELEELAAG